MPVIRLRRPSWFAVALTVCGVAAFVALGLWQLRRADYKVALLARFAQAAHAPLQPFAAVEKVSGDAAYPHATVRGQFLPDRVYLLDDQMRADQLGVVAYASFRPDNRDRVLLVALGFLPRQGVAQSLPDLPPLRAGETTLTGIYASAPRPGLKLGGNRLPAQTKWPKLVTYIDLSDIAADLGRTLYPRVLLLDPDPATTYVRLWVPDTMPPARHRAYALQWFTFALAAVVIFFVMHRVHGDAPNGND